MNRDERRAAEREEQKKINREKEAKRWVKSLTPDKARLIECYSKAIYTKEFDQMTDALDRCFTAAMIEKTEYPIKQINEIFTRAFELVSDDTEKVKELKRENGGDFMKALGKIQPEVNEKIIELLEGNVKQKEAIAELVVVFPKVSRSMLTNAYKKVKEAYIKEQEEEQVNQATKEILEIIEDKPVIEIKEDIVPKEDSIEVTTTENKEEVKEMESVKEVKKSGLKVKAMVVEGANGTYEVNEGGVLLGIETSLLAFDSIEKVDKFAEEIKEVFAMIS